MPAGVLLGIAILAEVVGTLALRASNGFTRLLPTSIVVVGYGIAFLLLSLVLRTIPVSVTYAIWSAAGTAAIALVGMTFLDEPAGAVKILSLALIVVGVLGLNLTGSGH